MNAAFKIQKVDRTHSLREQKNRSLIVDLTDADHSLLEQVAAEEGISTSELARQIVEFGRKEIGTPEIMYESIKTLTFRVREDYLETLKHDVKQSGISVRSVAQHWLTTVLADLRNRKHPRVKRTRKVSA